MAKRSVKKRRLRGAASVGEAVRTASPPNTPERGPSQPPLFDPRRLIGVMMAGCAIFDVGPSGIEQSFPCVVCPACGRRPEIVAMDGCDRVLSEEAAIRLVLPPELLHDEG